jgi:lipopolysaccharide transport system permease protein
MSVIEITSKRNYFPDLIEAWHHRHLGFMLVRRNIKVRYMQTLLGSVWIILQPLLLTGVLTLVLGIFLSVPSDGLPYVLFAFTGTTIWSSFNRAVTETSTSLAGSGNIILKVYFPRILIPLSSVLTSVVDLVPIYFLLVIAVIGYGHFPGAIILLSPFFILLAMAMAFSIGLWVTVLDAVFRDVRMAIPSALQLIFYATPIMYSDSVVPERWAWVMRLNPLMGAIKGFRWSMVAGAAPPDVFDVIWSVGFTGLIFVGGLALFARLENFAVDRI